MGKITYITGDEYLKKEFTVPEVMPDVPLPDEEYVSLWQNGNDESIPDFLARRFNITTSHTWEKPDAMRLYSVQTLAGHMPVLDVFSHADLCLMCAIMDGRTEPYNFPDTVNAVAMNMKAPTIQGQHLLLLNDAPYSNIAAAQLGLDEEDWLKRSHKLRMRHEAAHYECLRLLGNMQNHALDEIIADGMGQLAAFGDFSAKRQRLFFGLAEDSSSCTGRLSFYCKRVLPEDRTKVYKAVNKALEEAEERIYQAQLRNASQLDILLALSSIKLYREY